VKSDALGAEIGVDLASIGESEVQTTGGRRIDIVAKGEDGSEFVIENQYGKVDHDHLTRGLAYAVARRARGLVVVAEEHRDEFRAVAQYLKELAEHDPDRGIAVWLVAVRAVRIEDSPWAPLFTVVEEPNAFTARIDRRNNPNTARYHWTNSGPSSRPPNPAAPPKRCWRAGSRAATANGSAQPRGPGGRRALQERRADRCRRLLRRSRPRPLRVLHEREAIQPPNTDELGILPREVGDAPCGRAADGGVVAVMVVGVEPVGKEPGALGV
jgi:hypothetical protein